jgi:hypothetical protein
MHVRLRKLLKQDIVESMARESLHLGILTMTSFSRFQERNKKRVVAQQNLNTSFIFKGYPSIKISRGDLELQASVVNKQEKDYAYVYTQLKDNLEIGSVWTAKNLHLLITEEITIIKDVN